MPTTTFTSHIAQGRAVHGGLPATVVGQTLHFTWDRNTNRVTSFKLITSARTAAGGETIDTHSGPTETWVLYPGPNSPSTVMLPPPGNLLNLHHFDVEVWITLDTNLKSPTPNRIFGKLALNGIEGPNAATFASIMEGTGMSVEFSFGTLSGDLSTT